MSDETYPTPAPIYLITRIYHGKDDYNYPTCREELADEHGFFTKKDIAQEVADSLGPNVEQKLEEEHQAALKDHRKRLAAYEKREVELAALRAVRIKPSMASLHKPLEPKKRTRLQEDFYTTYEVTEVELNGKDWD